MSTSACKHSHLAIAASLLVLHGRIGGYEAVYDLMCPECSVKRRNTRLAATIHSLRHTFDWRIETVDKPGMLAEYVLRERKPYPRLIWEGPLVSPIRGLDPITPEEVPAPEAWTCTHIIDPKTKPRECGFRTTTPIERMLGGWVMAACVVHGVVPHRPAKEKKQP
jgi:hypothetical protein